MARPDSERKLHVRVDCAVCGNWECLSCFAADLPKRHFLQAFLECPACRHIACGQCIEDQDVPGELLCPHCGTAGLRKLAPEEIHRCNECLRVKKNLCGGPCRYPEHKHGRRGSRRR